MNTTITITKENKSIAEFMRTSYTSNAFRANAITPTIGELNYHKSWSLLMPVVQKILSPEMYHKLDAINEFNPTILQTNVKASLMSANILQVHEAVIEFIESYNKYKQ